MIFDNKPLDFSKIKKGLDTLDQSLASFNHQISAVLLFGSMARGKETALSDVDLAVLYAKDLSGHELNRVHSDVQEIITDVLTTDDIDLINLNTAPLSMQYGAIKQAKILVLNNRTEYIDFWEQTVKYYLDFKPLLDECNQVMLKTLAGRAVHG